MEQLSGKQILVIGAGASGIAAANFCCRRGARVVLNDARPVDRLSALSTLDPAVELVLGEHPEALFVAAQLVVVSPGVPLSLPALQAAIRAGVPLWGEIELASRFISAPCIAITGTNGKSTTTTLIGNLLRACGERVFVGGNIGVPLIEAVGSDYDHLVVELSSFQLETVERFHPVISLLLNLTPDHLDRYRVMAEYAAAKKNLFCNQTAQDLMVLNADDPLVLELAADCPARRVLFTSQRELEQGISFQNGRIDWRYAGQRASFDAGELKLRGVHNIENVMAALVPGLIAGYDPDRLWRAACEFGGLPHRMELVRCLDGVNWYNDSKGTNLGSVAKSLAGLSGAVTLIAGGKDKGVDYGELSPLLARMQPHLVLLGAAAQRMDDAWRGLCPISRAGSMAEAVRQARAVTPRGGTVLLSPGCSSFDMFRSFEDRGDCFVREVMALEA
ncbi:MAG: UDP-N-acetylmuramoyl-L-alanine--D-glutamate ligase [Desulfuromonadaceae bacterium]|nr:UDP-N-acetylmuramoyl-L-alanine--D-glutamate ligase [Desulfuromonadaceae bacterium]